VLQYPYESAVQHSDLLNIYYGIVRRDCQSNSVYGPFRFWLVGVVMFVAAEAISIPALSDFGWWEWLCLWLLKQFLSEFDIEARETQIHDDRIYCQLALLYNHYLILHLLTVSITTI
jgi:hypothetical protein